MSSTRTDRTDRADRTPRAGRSNRRFLLLLGAVALLVAGVVSSYASSHPDGLERVAESTGFIDTAEESANADGPLADYGVKGIDDERLSGGLAGVIGVGVTLLAAGGLGLLLRRRGTGGAPGAAPDAVPGPGVEGERVDSSLER